MAQDFEPQNALEAQGPTSSLSIPRDSKSTSSLRQDTVGHVLQFLADTSNEALGAIFVGLALFTILVLGRAGAVLIGLVAGFVLHAVWRGSRSSGGDGDALAKFAGRREPGIEVAKRVLDWNAQKKVAGEDAELQEKSSYLVSSTSEKPNFSTLPPRIAAALSSLTDAIIRDYVRWWYSPILPAEQVFVNTCQDTLTSFLLSISSHLSHKRPADMFLDFLANTSSIMIVFLNELGDALSTSLSTSTSPVDDIHDYVASNPESNLSNLLDREHQDRKLYVMAEDMLQTFLDPTVYNCRPAHVFLREMLAGVVLKMTLDSCSKPEWINGWIIYLLEENTLEYAEPNDVGINVNIGGPIRDQEVPPSPEPEIQAVSKAEAAMKHAIEEAERLSKLIAEEEAGRGPSESLTGDEHISDNGTTNRQSKAYDAKSTPVTESRPPVSGSQMTGPHTGSKSADINDGRSSYFTNFDQLLPDPNPTALQTAFTDVVSHFTAQAESQPTLYRASISILDDSVATGRGANHAKVNMEYLIQIEPSSSSQRGWMIARKFADFEKLHEVLRRISVVSGVSEFQQRHASLPFWKGQKRSLVQRDLEQYLQDALSYRQLAESEGMRRFLEKSQGGGTSAGKNAFPAALGTVGKGVLDVLTSAPKGVSGVLGGVGTLAQKKDGKTVGRTNSSKSFSKDPNHAHIHNSSTASFRHVGEDRDNADSLTSVSSQPTNSSFLESGSKEGDAVSGRNPPSPAPLSTSSRVSLNQISGLEYNQSSSGMDTPQRSPHSEGEEIHLPPLPTEIPDDYGSTIGASAAQPQHDQHQRIPNNPSSGSFTANSDETGTKSTKLEASAISAASFTRKDMTPLTEQEAQVAVDLSFAVINELYNLSSAWSIRRTLLTAAKNFLNLETIRALIQNSIIDANSSDEAIAEYVRKIEENTVPTEEQLKAWPTSPNDEEKEKMRIKARRLLVEKSLPPALTSVMGSAASREALGKVFDCLQLEEVARGLIFGLLFQALQVMTQ